MLWSILRQASVFPAESLPEDIRKESPSSEQPNNAWSIEKRNVEQNWCSVHDQIAVLWVNFGDDSHIDSSRVTQTLSIIGETAVPLQAILVEVTAAWK